MSSREHAPGVFSGRGNSFAQTASKAASVFDERVHRGADAVSQIAHQTAEQVGRASEYVQKQSVKFRKKAADAGEFANQHPLYAVLAVGLTGFALGLLLRRGRGRPVTTGMIM
jgi:ElaB/YqjD/DUF883 family membrane-anchored ribosome-binding protein